MTLIIACAVGYYLSNKVLSIQIMTEHLRQQGMWAWLIFICIYSLTTVLLFPGSVLTLVGGFLFGPIWGVVLNMAGAMIGATLSFLLARYLAADWISRKLGRKLSIVMNGIENNGWQFVAVVRLLPILPFNFLNYALGLTKISLLQYSVASFIFMLPGCVAYTYLGHLGEAVLSQKQDVVNKGLWCIGLFAVLFSIPFWVKKMKAYRQMNLDK